MNLPGILLLILILGGCASNTQTQFDDGGRMVFIGFALRPTAIRKVLSLTIFTTSPAASPC